MDPDALHGPVGPRSDPAVLVFTPHLLHRNALDLIARLAAGQPGGDLPGSSEGREADLGRYDRLRALALLDGEERLAELRVGGGPDRPTVPGGA